MEKRTWIRVEGNTSPTLQEDESGDTDAEENIMLQ